jgi:hypothetical protein
MKRTFLTANKTLRKTMVDLEPTPKMISEHQKTKVNKPSRKSRELTMTVGDNEYVKGLKSLGSPKKKNNTNKGSSKQQKQNNKNTKRKFKKKRKKSKKTNHDDDDKKRKVKKQKKFMMILFLKKMSLLIK